MPVEDNFALNSFTTERIVNDKLKRTYAKGRWADYLGDVTFEPGQLPAGLGQYGIVFKKEAGETMEDMLWEKKDLSSKVNAKKDSGIIRPNLATAVMGELLVACSQMHKAGIMHRDIKPENILVRRRLPCALVDGTKQPCIEHCASAFIATRWALLRMC